LTSGTLALGFYILLRDRRKEERSEAALVVCWRTWGNSEYTTHIVNASKRTIVDVLVLVRIDHLASTDRFPYESFHAASVIKPDEEVMVKTPRGGLGERNPPQLTTFQDADGLFWIRDLVSGQLERLKVRSSSGESALDRYIRHRRERSGLRHLMLKVGRSEEA
jgi:hypothetical protein